jgi:hypothetical protein
VRDITGDESFVGGASPDVSRTHINLMLDYFFILIFYYDFLSKYLELWRITIFVLPGDEDPMAKPF